MVLDTSVKVRSYKCFGEEEQGFEKILPLNIIIGKNNSGKSSLLDLIDYLINRGESFIYTGRDKVNSQVFIEDIILEDYIRGVFPRNQSGGGVPGESHYHYGLTLVGRKIVYELTKEAPKEIIKWDEHPKFLGEQYLRKMEAKIQPPLNRKLFFRILAERDIIPEVSDESNNEIQPNGKGATNFIRKVVTDSEYNPYLVRQELLNAINNIVEPDNKFVDITPRYQDNNVWEVYFRDINNKLIPLSKMGSGIKTILLVLLKMIVVPEVKGYDKQRLVFAFEELENNLHPSLQRRLFNFIADYCSKNKSYFFITTHSNVVIDIFSSNNDSQIIHVQNKNGKSFTKTLATQNDGKNILKDLEFKASDLLMSNGIVWVEGPSDLIYIELLLDLYRKDKNVLQEKNFNYSIQTLATAIWKYAGFTDFNWTEVNVEVENRIITLQKLNLNHLLIIDSDANYEDMKPSQWQNFINGTGKNKAKLIHESMKFSNLLETDLINNYGDNSSKMLSFWITEGTFESYLEYFIMNKGKVVFEKYFDLAKERGYFEKKRTGQDSSKSKVELAMDVAKYFFENNLTIDDIAPIDSSLRNKIERLNNTILSWN